MKRNWIILVLVVAAIAGVFVYNNEADKTNASSDATGKDAEAAKPKPGSIAPTFYLPALGNDNLIYQVDGKRDKILIVNFWASWCGPCEEEAPDLNKIYAKYKNDVDLYAVNATKYDVLREAKRFAKEHQFEFPVLTDADGSVGDRYKVFSYPISFIIGRDGTILERIEGTKKVAEWESMLDKAINA